MNFLCLATAAYVSNLCYDWPSNNFDCSHKSTLVQSQSIRTSLYFQDHYDWGLRAIKSVLVVAGSLKRSDRDRPEDQVLMRALRDFNIPKIVTDDVPVFMGLIGDLFPALDVPRKRDMDFEALVKKSALVRINVTRNPPGAGEEGKRGWGRAMKLFNLSL